MKKIVLILMLGVFSFGSSGFSNLENSEVLNPEVNCNEYAAGEWLKWKGLGLRGDDLTDIFVEAYWDCSNPDWWLDY